MIRLSVGTAAVLGLLEVSCATLPTIAYLLVGDHCNRGCAFCSQGKDQNTTGKFLSRVPWLPFPLKEVTERIVAAYSQGRIAGICLQMLGDQSSSILAKQIIGELRRCSQVPIALCTHTEDIEGLTAWKELGVNRLGLPLDAACEAAYRRTKPGSFFSRLAIIKEAARLYPGAVSTHLIVGLGEKEEEMVNVLQQMVNSEVTVGLFAFTPVPGTPYGHKAPPSLARYRRVQVAYYLMRQKVARKEDFTFNEGGDLIDFGLTPEHLRRLLATGEAFRTTGCPGCNRPYYNERVRGPLYNYPRPLTRKELDEAFSLLGLEE